MAVSVSEIVTNVEGALRTKTVNVTFDSSYPTGGEAFSTSDLGFGTVFYVEVLPTAGYVFEYVASTGKIKAYWVDTTTDGAAMAEVANTTNLSTVTAIVKVVGKP